MMGAGASTTHTALGQVRAWVVLLHPRLMRRGYEQHEKIILANYSPASLVLSKIL